MDKKMLLNYDPRDFDQIFLSETEVLSWFDVLDAGWSHDGDPKKPHAELTSGKCSNGFFDCLRVLCLPNLNAILANQLARRLTAERVGRVDWVIGSPYAAITFSYEVAKALGAIHGFVEKDSSDSAGKKMVWRRIAIPRGSKVLQVEELITTSGTFQEVRRAVEVGNSEPIDFLPVVGALIHRPPKLPVTYNGRKVIALVEKEVWAVDPSECPLCKQGSKRVRPKTHWKELTGKA